MDHIAGLKAPPNDLAQSERCCYALQSATDVPRRCDLSEADLVKRIDCAHDTCLDRAALVTRLLGLGSTERRIEA
ncbi:hypothetical protein HZ992_22735 [Rhizobacter sp. AJA081-3]|nr:hypothetical protein HZ992_22735 [Rhizobacter sp. AJA081-3]